MFDLEKILRSPFLWYAIFGAIMATLLFAGCACTYHEKNDELVPNKPKLHELNVFRRMT